MKLFPLSLLTAGILLPGCATHNGGLVLDTVGPSAFELPATPTSANGTLLVYSAFRRNAEFSSSDPYHQAHSDYKIFTPDGQLLQKVHNNSGTILEDAVTVNLPAGQYQVRARANGYGFVTVPVRIKPDQCTIVHLEGDDAWPGTAQFNQTNSVRLPDGEIVGYKG